MSISVIIPCYCCADTIERAILSILNQTLPPDEILLIEDNGPDDGLTLNILYDLQKKYQNEIQIEVIALPKNDGPGTARNAGWEKARSKYIAFLDADDSWHPQKCEIQFKWMEDHPDVAMTGHQTEVFKNQTTTYDLSSFPATEVSRRKLLLSNRFPTRSVMLKREITERFEPGKRRAEDFLLWLNIFLSGKKAFRIELPLAYSYKSDYGATGLSGQLWEMEKGELHTYWKIFQIKQISSFELVFSMTISLLKYFKRVMTYTFLKG